MFWGHKSGRTLPQFRWTFSLRCTSGLPFWYPRQVMRRNPRGFVDCKSLLSLGHRHSCQDMALLLLHGTYTTPGPRHTRGTWCSHNEKLPLPYHAHTSTRWNLQAPLCSYICHFCTLTSAWRAILQHIQISGHGGRGNTSALVLSIQNVVNNDDKSCAPLKWTKVKDQPFSLFFFLWAEQKRRKLRVWLKKDLLKSVCFFGENKSEWRTTSCSIESCREKIILRTYNLSVNIASIQAWAKFLSLPGSKSLHCHCPSPAIDCKRTLPILIKSTFFFSCFFILPFLFPVRLITYASDHH